MSLVIRWPHVAILAQAIFVCIWIRSQVALRYLVGTDCLLVDSIDHTIAYSGQTLFPRLCVVQSIEEKYLCPLTCALLHNLTYIDGFKRTDTFCSREGSDRHSPVATLPRLISAVFGISREPTLESRLSAVSFGILVVAKQLFTTTTFTKKDQE